MAQVTKDANASLDDSTAMYAGQISGLIAGAAIGALDACYIKAADGKAYPSNGSAATEAAKFDGFAARAASAGDPVTLFSNGARFHYGTGLTPGTDLYIGTAAGSLADAATTGGTSVIARVINSTDVRCTRNHA